MNGTGLTKQTREKTDCTKPTGKSCEFFVLYGPVFFTGDL
jgi:hypothetical protein